MYKEKTEEEMNIAKSCYNEMILSSLKISGGVFVDDYEFDHTKRKATYIARFVKNQIEHIVLLIENEFFGINPMTIDREGMVHLSRWSIGAAINSSNFPTMEEAVEDYNKEANTMQWNIGLFKEVIKL